MIHFIFTSLITSLIHSKNESTSSSRCVIPFSFQFGDYFAKLLHGRRTNWLWKYRCCQTADLWNPWTNHPTVNWSALGVAIEICKKNVLNITNKDGALSQTSNPDLVLRCHDSHAVHHACNYQALAKCSRLVEREKIDTQIVTLLFVSGPYGSSLVQSQTFPSHTLIKSIFKFNSYSREFELSLIGYWNCMVWPAEEVVFFILKLKIVFR